jgi:hypothetical protein
MKRKYDAPDVPQQIQMITAESAEPKERTRAVIGKQLERSFKTD